MGGQQDGRREEGRKGGRQTHTAAQADTVLRGPRRLTTRNSEWGRRGPCGFLPAGNVPDNAGLKVPQWPRGKGRAPLGPAVRGVSPEQLI